MEIQNKKNNTKISKQKNKTIKNNSSSNSNNKSKNNNSIKIIRKLKTKKKFIDKGGQGNIYNYNNKLLVRVFKNIDFPKYENNIAIFINKIINISKCKHFLKIEKILKNNKNNNNYYLMKKYDTDLAEKYKTLSNDIKIQCYFQILIACILLTKNKLLNFDIKLDNILIKYKNNPYIFIYKIGDKYYKLKSNYLVVMCDYGKIIKCDDIKYFIEKKNYISDKSLLNCNILTNIDNLEAAFKPIIDNGVPELNIDNYNNSLKTAKYNDKKIGKIKFSEDIFNNDKLYHDNLIVTFMNYIKIIFDKFCIKYQLLETIKQKDILDNENIAIIL